jgi:hypothetical protein
MTKEFQAFLVEQIYSLRSKISDNFFYIRMYLHIKMRLDTPISRQNWATYFGVEIVQKIQKNVLCALIE